jgi:hypothetical protein
MKRTVTPRKVFDTAFEFTMSNLTRNPAVAGYYSTQIVVDGRRLHNDDIVQQTVSVTPAPLHYPGVDIHANELDHVQRAPTRLQIEPANADNSSSHSLVHEACTQTVATISEEDSPVGGNGRTINIVTLHGIWRLTSTATSTDGGDRDSTGLDVDDHDLFVIPIEESLIGQQSSLHELVID